MIPERIKNWLIKERRLGANEIACLGWNGRAIVIPIRRRDGSIFNKYRRDPDVKEGLRYFADAGGGRTLYGAELITPEVKTIWIAEGELDALRLRSLGLTAVSATCGANTWDETWNELFRGKEVYIWYDADHSGRRGARRVAENLAGIARQVWIVSHDPTKGGKDLTDFLRHHKLGSAMISPFAGRPKRKRESFTSDIFSEKTHSIMDILDRYDIHHGGVRREMSIKCPFHDDKMPSLSINTEKNLWFCHAGCGGGNVYSFVMKMENCDFKEALRLLA